MEKQWVFHARVKPTEHRGCCYRLIVRHTKEAVIVQGPLNAIRSKEIEGYTDEAGWGAVRSWYEEITSRLPITGEWYPADPPTMERSMVRKDGQDVTRCTIAFQLWEVV